MLTSDLGFDPVVLLYRKTSTNVGEESQGPE